MSCLSRLGLRLRSLPRSFPSCEMGSLRTMSSAARAQGWALRQPGRLGWPSMAGARRQRQKSQPPRPQPGPRTHTGTSFLRDEPQCVTCGEWDAEGSMPVALLSPGQGMDINCSQVLFCVTRTGAMLVDNALWTHGATHLHARAGRVPAWGPADLRPHGCKNSHTLDLTQNKFCSCLRMITMF